MRSKNMALSWRRLSMRKTCPIDLPEQHSSKDAMHNAFRSTAHIPRSLSSSSSSSANRSNSIVNVTSTNENNENYCSNETMTSSTTSSNTFLLSHNHENNEMSMISDQHTDHSLSNQYIDNHDQLPELNSLNNEFLNTILTTTNYQQNVGNSNANTNSLQHETNFLHNMEDDSDSMTAFEDSRPRQLGRRSEMRSRIVSITAERNAEGNQVSF